MYSVVIDYFFGGVLLVSCIWFVVVVNSVVVLHLFSLELAVVVLLVIFGCFVLYSLSSWYEFVCLCGYCWVALQVRVL